MTKIHTAWVLGMMSLIALGTHQNTLYAAPTSPCDGPRSTADSDDRAKLTALDTEYQAAVKLNDAVTMDRLLANDFVLIVGTGQTFTKADLLEEARSGRIHYEHQESTHQHVRVWGDTAVVTALLHEAGTTESKSFDKTLWFSDTYIRTSSGWKYVLGQASLPLP